MPDPGNAEKVQTLPLAHSPVACPEQHVSAQVLPLQRPERQSRAFVQLAPPAPVPRPPERPIHWGRTQ